MTRRARYLRLLTRGLHWFRNDLRLRDNTALDALAQRAEQWLPVFVIDPRLAGPHAARRTAFLLDTLAHLGRDLDAPLFLDYPRPIADHAQRRVLALERYRAARAGAGA